MSRSIRKPYFYRCYGSRPKQGKTSTSRRIRRAVKQELQMYDGGGFDFIDPQDKNRGIAGSRSPDWGWVYFGDGRVSPYSVFNYQDEDWYINNCRK